MTENRKIKVIICKGLLLTQGAWKHEKKNTRICQDVEPETTQNFGSIRVIYSNKLINYASDYTCVPTSVQIVDWIKKVSSESVASLSESITSFSTRNHAHLRLCVQSPSHGRKAHSERRANRLIFGFYLSNMSPMLL